MVITFTYMGSSGFDKVLRALSREHQSSCLINLLYNVSFYVSLLHAKVSSSVPPTTQSTLVGLTSDHPALNHLLPTALC